MDDVARAARALGYVMDGMDAPTQWGRAVALLRSMDACGVALVWVALGSHMESVVGYERCRLVFELATAEARQVCAVDSGQPVGENDRDASSRASSSLPPPSPDRDFEMNMYEFPPDQPRRQPQRPQTAPPQLPPRPPIPREPGETAQQYLDRIADGRQPQENLIPGPRPTIRRIHVHEAVATTNPNDRQPGETPDAFARRRAGTLPVVDGPVPAPPPPLPPHRINRLPHWLPTFRRWPFAAPPRNDPIPDGRVPAESPRRSNRRDVRPGRNA